MATRIVICIVLGSVGAVSSSAALVTARGSNGALAQQERVRWYAAHEHAPSVNLGAAVQNLSLKGGWSCTVGQSSQQLPSYEARTTICSKGRDALEFTVQCEQSRRKDHTQIRFRSGDRLSGEFIEIGCELTSPEQ